MEGEIWAALAALTAMEIVLGIDNIVFISLLAGKLPIQEQAKARLWGLGLAMFSRIALLFSLVWVMSLTQPLFAIWQRGISGRDLILLAGGVFLVVKSTKEIHEKMEEVQHLAVNPSIRLSKEKPGFLNVLAQIIILDIVFSLDSVITAVGMANQFWVMAAAIVIAVLVMMVFSNMISKFINENPPVKVLALAFLLLVGVVLMAEGLGQEIPKGYVYAAMAFSMFVEFLNIKMSARKPSPLMQEIKREAQGKRL